LKRGFSNRRINMDIISLPVEYDRNKIDGRFRIIAIAAQRAKELAVGAQSRVKTKAKKVSTIALEETIQNAVEFLIGDEAKKAKEDAKRFDYRKLLEEKKKEMTGEDLTEFEDLRYISMKETMDKKAQEVSLKNERKVLKNKSVLLGVTGGVAAYKALDVIRRLREEGASVTVISTEAAGHFVTPLSLEVASGTKVYTDLFSNPLSHITRPSQADIFLIAPATANSIGKFANGIADDLLSTCMLAFPGKAIIAPSMNWRMFENPVVQENLQKLVSRGFIQVGPEKGPRMRRRWGRLADVPDIMRREVGSRKDLSRTDHRHQALQYLDPSFLSNDHQGKWGYAIARAALRRGDLISGFLHCSRRRTLISSPPMIYDGYS
jgi:DNA-directed RNA polymerase subunit K/omega